MRGACLSRQVAEGLWQRAADILHWYKNPLVPQEGAIKGGVYITFNNFQNPKMYVQ